MDINLVQIISKLDNKNHPLLDGYKFSSHYSKIGYQFWITINLVQIIPKLDDQFCMIINLVQIIPKVDD